MFGKRKSLFLLFPLFLLTLLLLIVFVSPALLGSFAQALMQSQQGGQGGAFGATSYTLPGSMNAPATSLNDPGQVKMYGGSGPGGSCLGTSGAGDDMIKMDFGWAASYLSKDWQNYAAYRLCNDHYMWETVTVLPLQQVLQTLQWPPDLLDPKFANQVVTLEPLSSFDPVTQQAQQQQQQANEQDQSKGACDWVPNLGFVHPHIDICAPLRLLVHAGSSAIRGVYQNATAQINFLWQTPLQPFQDDKTSGLLTIWSISWSIVLACITAVIAYGALRYMLGSAVNWLAYANIAELIPRLLFGLLAAYFSKEFFIMLIQANNALAAIFNQHSLDVVIYGKASGVINESLQIVYGLMGFLLIVEEAARLAIIYLLFAFAPVLFFFASLRETQRWAKIAAVAAIIFVFLQAIQAATLDVGGRVLSTILHNTDGQLSFLNILISLAILYITLSLFFTLARIALGYGADPLDRGVRRTFGVPRVAMGYVGGIAANYRRAITPPPPKFTLDPRYVGNASGSQTSVGIKAQPSVTGSSGAPTAKNSSGSSSPGGATAKTAGGSSGSGNTNAASSGSSLAPLNTQAGANKAASGGSASASRGPGASSAPTPGQWQKTPPRRVPRPPINPMKP